MNLAHNSAMDLEKTAVIIQNSDTSSVKKCNNVMTG